MIAVLAVVGALTLLVLFALLGRPNRQGRQHLSQICLLTLPIMTVSAAATLSVGFTLTSAAIATVTVLLALLAAVLTKAPDWAATMRPAPAATALAWVCSIVVATGFVVVLLELAIWLVADFTNLNYQGVAFVVVAAGVGAGLGRRSSLGQARIVMTIILVAAVLLFVGGLAMGSVDSFGDPTLTVGVPGWPENIVFPIAVVIAAAANPELRRVDATQRRALVVAAIVMGVATALSFTGLLMIVGGAIEVPSVQLNSLVAFLPDSVGAILALIAALIGAVATARLVGFVADAVAVLRPRIARTPKAPITEVCSGVILGVVLIAMTIWRPTPAGLVMTLAFAAMVGLIAELAASRRATAVTTDTRCPVCDTPRGMI